jgi:hypothetical protein
MKKSDKPSRVDKSNLLVKYVGIKDIPQNSEMFSKLSKSVTYEEEDVVVNSNIENLTPSDPTSVFISSCADPIVSRSAL